MFYFNKGKGRSWARRPFLDKRTVSFYDSKYIKEDDEFCFGMIDLGFPRWSVRYLCLEIDSC